MTINTPLANTNDIKSAAGRDETVCCTILMNEDG